MVYAKNYSNHWVNSVSNRTEVMLRKLVLNFQQAYDGISSDACVASLPLLICRTWITSTLSTSTLSRTWRRRMFQLSNLEKKPSSSLRTIELNWSVYLFRSSYLRHWQNEVVSFLVHNTSQYSVEYPDIIVHWEENHVNLLASQVTHQVTHTDAVQYWKL